MFRLLYLFILLTFLIANTRTVEASKKASLLRTAVDQDNNDGRGRLRRDGLDQVQLHAGERNRAAVHALLLNRVVVREALPTTYIYSDTQRIAKRSSESRTF